MATDQHQVDTENAGFWDELCGTGFARALGVTDGSPESLARFDEGYLDFYPYLEGYLPGPEEAGKKVLEMGLGFGTVGQMLAERGLDYHGLDIAEGPVLRMRERVANVGRPELADQVQQGSALENPHPDDFFDHVVTIGCLHHTGDLPKAVSEVHRVLKPGGRALVMLYNRNSFRRVVIATLNLPKAITGKRTTEEQMRWTYDHNEAGEAAPFTEYVSKRQVEHLFSGVGFSSTHVRRENWDDVQRGPLVFKRKWVLGNLAHLAGIDLYITATK